MVRSLTKACPRGPRKPPKNEKNEFFMILEGQMHIFPTFFDGQLCGFERSLGALGGPRGRPGAPWGLQSELLGGSGGSRRKGNRSQRLQGGVWEAHSAIPRRVHIHQIHIFVRYFDDFQKGVFFQSELGGRWGLSLGGVFCAPCGSMGPSR